MRSRSWRWRWWGELRAGRARVDAAVEEYVGRVAGKLADRARRDSLTGVLNHAAFQSRLADEAARATRYKGRLALAVFDLDRFKEINDQLGHQEGDRLLREFARTLAVTVRVSDSVGRLAAFLERLYARLPPDIAVSAGSAFLPADASTPEQLLALADQRLYTQKAARAA